MCRVLLSYLSKGDNSVDIMGIAQKCEASCHGKGIKHLNGTSNQEIMEVSAQLAHRVIRDYNLGYVRDLLVEFVNQAQRLVLRSQFYPQSKTHHY